MRTLHVVLDTHRRNFRMTAWPIAVLDPLNEARAIVETFEKQAASITANPHLTPEGKAAERSKARQAALDAIAAWHAPRLAGLDADLAKHRAALIKPPTEKPDGRRMDFLLGQLRSLTPDEVSTFYATATDDERRLMEAASDSVGRVPMKTAKGMHWRPLLDPEMVAAAVIERAAVENPAGAKKLEELAEIRAMHVSVAGIAAAEIRQSGGNEG